VQPGDVIDGKYQIEAELGRGGMGQVLAATHVALGGAVAIKVLKREALKVPELPRRFLREARAAHRLRNEHVVRVMDVGQLPTGEPYMVMEMLRGVDLSTMLEAGPVPPGAAVEYIAQACEGLAEAHGLGMIHRDIKPANLFVTKRANGAPLVKLLDFGIATAAIDDVDPNLTSTLTVMGSPSYMSPEQLRAARDVDARSDIWSLGVTLYELISGEQPFDGPTLTALTLQIASEPHTPLRGVPPELAAIVDRCLAKDREHRFASVAELAAALAPLFPNGRVHAEQAASSLGSPATTTLLGIAASTPHMGTARPRAASSVPWASPPPVATTTTGFTAGQSAQMPPIGRRRAAWLVLGAAVTGAIVMSGIMLSQRSASSAAVPPPPAAAPLKQEIPPADPPAAAVATPPAPAPEPEPASPPPAAPAPEPAPAPTPTTPTTEPAAPPEVSRPPVRRTPPRRPLGKPEIKPEGKPPVAPPKEPVKKPCAPSDPTCGL
jgi:serine/threonine-protein kinase